MNLYLVIILSLLLGQFLFKIVIEAANLLNISEQLPKQLVDDYPQDLYKQSQNYLKENTLLDLSKSAFFTFILFILILSDSFNWIDQFARSFHLNEILTGLIFLGIIILGSIILKLPFDIYGTFIIEEKYGFNRTTTKTFILDLIKHLLLTGLFAGIAIAALLWFFEHMGSAAWVYCWIAIVAYQLILAYIAPTWIMPLFNQFTPLAEGELKEAIQSYAKQQDFALRGIFTMDGSKRSTKSNAFFTGFGKNRRIVLFDTLIQRHSTDELVSVLAHEIGHYKKKHLIKMILISIATTGILFYCLSLFLNNPELFQAFGMKHLSIYASFLFFGFLFTPIQIVLAIASNALSRHFEYEADQFAIQTFCKPEAMILALKKLSLDNLSNLTPHPWKVAISYSHPTLIQRIEAINQTSKSPSEDPIRTKT